MYASGLVCRVAAPSNAISHCSVPVVNRHVSFCHNLLREVDTFNCISVHTAQESHRLLF